MEPSSAGNRTRSARHTGIVAVAFLAMTTASCLITSTPDFEPPAQTPPFLVAENATPDPRQLVIVQPDQDEVLFSAFVRSEDAEAKVGVRLLVDYGTESADTPFRIALQGKTVAASHMEDRTRLASAKWNRNTLNLEGCHRFTLMVSHAFDDTNCPLDLADSDSLTWNVVICKPGEDCPPLIDPSVDCALPLTPAACPQLSPELSGASSSASAGGGAP